MSEDGQRLALTVLSLEALEDGAALFGLGDEEDGGFGEGPLEVGVSDLVPAAAEALSGGASLALDETGVGGEVANGGEAGDVVDLLEDSEGEDLSDAGDGGEEGEGVWVVDARLAEHRELELADDEFEVVGEGEVGGDGLADARVREVFAEAFPVGAIGDALAGRIDVLLVVGDLDMGEERASLSDEEESVAHEVAGGSHVGGIGVGAGHQASPEEHGDLLGVDAVALGLGVMDDPHVEGMTEDEGDELTNV